MINRYQAPHATRIFDEQVKINMWLDESVRAMVALDPDSADELTEWYRHMASTEVITAEAVRTAETRTRHDVVAFLELLELHLPEPYHHLLHYGMTSSDLVENTHHMMLKRHTTRLLNQWHTLCSKVYNMATAHADTTRPGRTHGQLAEPVSWGHQLDAWLVGGYGVQQALSELIPSMLIYKSVGPTGRSLLRSNYRDALQSTQVINRDRQLAWASTYLRAICQLDSLATLIRCGARYEIDELREGQAPDQVGSSAMPAKSNPIRCEQINGLARVARGNFMAIAETTGDLWDDRDISNSSVERTAVVDLAHLTEYATIQMTQVIHSLEVDEYRMRVNAKQMGAWRSVMQGLVQKTLRIGPVAASALVAEVIGSDLREDEWMPKIYVRIVEIDGGGSDRANELVREFALVWDSVFSAPFESPV